MAHDDIQIIEEPREIRRRLPFERTIFIAPKKTIMGFLDFVRERGVVGLAVGFVLGGAVSKVTTSFSADILNPVIASVFGGAAGLAEFSIGSVAIGKFIAAIVDFLVLALAVYLIFKVLRLDKLDKPKE